MVDPQAPAYFFSDAHLTTFDSAVDRARNRQLDGFLAHVRESASRLYILGDLFDFWFRYRHAMPAGYVWLYRRLLDIRDAGIPTVFLAGNHDYWCMEFLAEEFGFETHAGPVSVTLQGRRLWLAHGDGLVARDWPYRALRRVLRNRWCIAAYRLVHPDVGIPLAHGSSTSSRHYTEQRDPAVDAYRTQVVQPKLEAGYDAVLLGHVHVPTHARMGTGEFLFLGDWIRHYTFATLAEGRFTHWRWTGTAPERLEGGPTEGEDPRVATAP